MPTHIPDTQNKQWTIASQYAANGEITAFRLRALGVSELVYHSNGGEQRAHAFLVRTNADTSVNAAYAAKRHREPGQRWPLDRAGIGQFTAAFAERGL